jgi:CheY-like chemotaxis protein
MLAYAGKGRFHLERLDLSSQVREIVPLVGASISKLVEVRLRLAENLPPVEADRSQIQQLIMNLVINGAEAIGDRPGFVTVSTSRRAAESEDLIVLEVADTGAGMSAEVKARVFDPFFTTKFTGRGLGLSAVVGIIRSHRGSISVESEPGKGAVFTVVLPAASGEVDTLKLPTETELRGFGHILIVDDEELVRNMARFTLDRYGYTVELASDGNDAVEKFGARPGEFTAVLLDLTMPNLNGEQALRSIRRIHPQIPVVLSSGFTESEALKRFVDLGLAGFLQKPYTATALARKMKQALNGPSSRLDKRNHT